jgi:hypothetical protein
VNALGMCFVGFGALCLALSFWITRPRRRKSRSPSLPGPAVREFDASQPLDADSAQRVTEGRAAREATLRMGRQELHELRRQSKRGE